MLRFVVFIFGIITIMLAASHKPARRLESTELIVPPHQLKYFTLGYNETIADSLWIRTIQDFDTCGKAESEASEVRTDARVVELDLPARTGRCENSWVYKMVDAITEIAPHFRAPYSDGGTILSVTVDDVEGASRIFDKAVHNFPEDWQIHYKAAYHFLYEASDREKAAKLLISAGQHGGPKWLPILAARLYSKSGRAALGKAVLSELLENNPQLAENEHIQKRMAEIERDLAAGDDPEPSTASQPGAVQKSVVKPTALPKKKQ